jgi:nitrate reductase NapE component
MVVAFLHVFVLLVEEVDQGGIGIFLKILDVCKFYDTGYIADAVFGVVVSKIELHRFREELIKLLVCTVGLIFHSILDVALVNARFFAGWALAGDDQGKKQEKGRKNGSVSDMHAGLMN